MFRSIFCIGLLLAPTTSVFAADSSAPAARQTAIVHAGKRYLLRYEPRASKVILTQDRQTITLETIPRNYSPSLVGADEIIGFLPEALQVYRSANILVYASAIRSTGGRGNGYCGAGAEVFLKFLDVSTNKPRLVAKHLVASCMESIELEDQELPRGVIGAISPKGGRLALRFLNHGNREGDLTAVVSEDLQTLEFQEMHETRTAG